MGVGRGTGREGRLGGLSPQRVSSRQEGPKEGGGRKRYHQGVGRSKGGPQRVAASTTLMLAARFTLPGEILQQRVLGPTQPGEHELKQTHFRLCNCMKN